jgi:hypothetical protein
MSAKSKPSTVRQADGSNSSETMGVHASVQVSDVRCRTVLRIHNSGKQFTSPEKGGHKRSDDDQSGLRALPRTNVGHGMLITRELLNWADPHRRSGVFPSAER